MAIQLLGFPTTLGLPRQAIQHAPAALRSAGLVQQLRRLVPVEDLGDLPLPELHTPGDVPGMVTAVVDAAGQQADLWLRHHQPGHLMLTLGGDHSTSLGTIQALSRMGHSFDVVWIDAHGDFNIIETSPTGNVHGMVLALACGLMPAYAPGYVMPSNLRLWGIRDLDPGERDLLTQHRVEVLDPDQTRHEWDRIVKRLKPNILLSFDLDSVEPDQAPGTMTPVPNGFHRHEALQFVAHLAREKHILALDIVEFHPDYDRQNLTLQLALDVVTTAVSGQVERRQKGFSAAAGA